MPTWSYSVERGWLEGPDGGWAGHSGEDAGRNNPQAQNSCLVGPIPEGDYEVLPVEQGTPWGDWVVPLRRLETGWPSFGRGGVVVHGPLDFHGQNPGHTCVVMPEEARRALARAAGAVIEVRK